MHFTLPPANIPLIVACSGGRDSICLLHLLWKQNYDITCVYVHHHLRPEADQEARWIQNLAAQWGIPCKIKHVDVPTRVKETGESTEEAARILRYQALQEEAGEKKMIVTAHHADDQAETVLLHMIRGCGLTGLTGMAEKRDNILRPLLHTTRSEIEAYINENNLPYVEDASNQDTQYTRNWIRHELIPMLQKQNPNISQTISEMADNLRIEEEFIQKAADKHYQEGTLLIQDDIPQALEKRLIRRYIQENGGLSNVTSAHIKALQKLKNQQSGARVTLPGGRIFQRQFDQIVLIQKGEKQEEIVEVPVDNQWHDTPWGQFRAEIVPNPMRNFGKIPDLQYTKWLSCDTITERLFVRTRREGDFLSVKGGRKSVKKFMIDQKIVREKRDQIALVADGSHILWIVGHRLSDACRVQDENEMAVRMDFRPAE